MKTTFLLLRIQTSKRIAIIFLLFAVLSMWAAADAYAQTKVTIYPNPTRGMLKVDISGVEKFENARISLYDLTGTLLQQWGSISQSNAVDISDRTPGMYIMQIVYNGNTSSWKIIKE